MSTITPTPGDVIVLSPHRSVAWGAGKRAVIDSTHFGMDLGKGPIVLAVVGASAFRPTQPPADGPYVSCSGGPCPFVPLSNLRHVGTTEQSFWHWKDYPRRDGGETYTAVVNLWEEADV